MTAEIAAPEYERAALACVTAHPELLPQLSPSLLYLDDSRAYLALLRDLIGRKIQPELPTLVSAAGAIPNGLSVTKIFDIATAEYIPANFPHYLATLRACAERCKTIGAARSLLDRLQQNGEAPGAALADFWERVGDLDATADTREPVPTCSVVDVLTLTRSDRARVRTGLPALDLILGGGIPARRLLLLGGTTAAGKTALALQLAEAFTEAGGVAVVLPYDEGAEPAAVRVGEQHGFERAQVEDRLDSLLVKLAGELEGKALRFPVPTAPADPTIEDGAEAVAALMRERPGAPGLLVVDSIQRAHTRTSEGTRSERERITDNTQTARRRMTSRSLPRRKRTARSIGRSGTKTA